MKKVLVIEDNKDILDNIAEILQLSNFKVFTADNGRVGIEQAILHEPDLIVCDIMMPELDGYGVLHIIQNNSRLRDIPFIFLTARTEQNDIRKGMSMGADDYILKPFDPTDLLNAIEARLKKSDFVRQHITQEIRENGSSDAEEVLKEFISGRYHDKYKKKQRIFSEGNHPLRLYYVRKGKVKIFKMNDTGKELIVNIVNENEFFGYTAMLVNSVYKENADALEDSEIVSIPGSEFEKLIQTNPSFARKFIKLLADDVAEKEELLLHIAYNSLRRKVADALLTVQKKYKDVNGNFNINLSRENLAAVAGTATESLIRTLTDFKMEKLIDISDGKITILNRQKLENMVN